MNAYFFGISPEERNNILDQHKHVYDGAVTQYVKPEQQPLYVQDFANDKGGVTVNSKGEVTQYKNMNINEQSLPQDFIADGEDDFEYGVYGEKGEFCANCNGSGYDDSTNRVCDWCGGSGSEENVGDLMADEDSDIDDVTIIDIIGDNDMDDEEVIRVETQIKESLDMFKRFKKYN